MRIENKIIIEKPKRGKGIGAKQKSIQFSF
jgi:hypothetical protein